MVLGNGLGWTDRHLWRHLARTQGTVLRVLRDGARSLLRSRGAPVAARLKGAVGAVDHAARVEAGLLAGVAASARGARPTPARRFPGRH